MVEHPGLPIAGRSFRVRLELSLRIGVLTEELPTAVELARILSDLAEIQSACVAVESLAVVSRASDGPAHPRLRWELLDAYDTEPPELVVQRVEFGSVWLELAQYANAYWGYLVTAGGAGVAGAGSWAMRRILKHGTTDVIRDWAKLDASVKADREEERARGAEARARRQAWEAEADRIADERRRLRIEQGMIAADELQCRYPTITVDVLDPSGELAAEPPRVKEVLDEIGGTVTR